MLLCVPLTGINHLTFCKAPILSYLVLLSCTIMSECLNWLASLWDDLPLDPFMPHFSGERSLQIPVTIHSSKTEKEPTLSYDSVCSLFFVLYLLLGLYFLTNLVLAVIFDR